MMTVRRQQLAAAGCAVVLTLGLGVGTAGAQLDPYVADDGQEQGDEVDGEVTVEDPADGGTTQVASDPSTRVSASSLPVTGGEALALSAIGGGLVLAGTAGVVAGRRRRLGS